jgi:hypothetical protein
MGDHHVVAAPGGSPGDRGGRFHQAAAEGLGNVQDPHRI